MFIASIGDFWTAFLVTLHLVVSALPCVLRLLPLRLLHVFVGRFSQSCRVRLATLRILEGAGCTHVC
jgi:hypothetical protein